MVISVLQFLILALSPLYIIRFNLPLIGLPSTLLELLLWIYFGVFLIQFKKDGFNFQKFKSKFDLPIAIFLTAATISIFVSLDKWGALGVFRAYFLEPILFYYTLIYSNDKKTSKAVFWGLLTAAIWLSILSVIQKFTGQFSQATNEISQGRVSAVYNSANALALFLGPVIFLTAGFFFKVKKNNRYLLILLITFFSVIVFWTKSRGGLVAEALTFAIFGFGLMTLKYRIFKKFWGVLPLTIILLVIFFFYQIVQVYGNPNAVVLEDNSYGDTLQIRYNLWVGTINLLSGHLLLGAGLNGFKELYGGYYRLTFGQEPFQYPHNIILNFWTETGLLGLVSFIWILVGIFINFWKSFFNSNYKVVGLGIFCAFCYTILHGLVDVPYFKNDLSLQFWSLLALFELWLRNKT